MRNNIIAVILSLTLLSSCAAVVLGGTGVGAYYLGKYYAHKQDAYAAYVADCNKNNITPLDYKSWNKLQ